MLQIYGNWVAESDAASRPPIMEKAAVFQLHCADSNALNLELLRSIADFLVDPMYSKVFHNYSVDAHSLNNALRTLSRAEGRSTTLKVGGFAADTMHLARLWDAGWWPFRSLFLSLSLSLLF